MLKDLQAFEDWLIGSGAYSVTTARTAVRAIRFLQKSMDVDSCSQEDIMRFVRSQVQKKRRNKTIENQMQALRHYRQFTGNPVEVVKLRKQKSSEAWVPDDSDVSRIFRYVRGIKDPAKRSLYTTLVYVLAYTGARIGEISGIDLQDVMEKESAIYIRAEKNEPSRMLVVPASVISAIMNHVNNYRPATDPRALFPGPKGRMSPDRLRMIVKKIGREAGVPRLHSHAFRHRVATTLFNAGADLREVQRQLGHVSPSSTRVYDHSDRFQTSRVSADRLAKYYLRATTTNDSEACAGTRIETRGEGFEPSLS